MNDFSAVNSSFSEQNLDLTTFTIYPGVHGNANEGPLGFRMGTHGDVTLVADDFFSLRINGAHGIMELQPGQVNWGEVNPQPYPGAVHLWLMRAFAEGAKLVCTYRYREVLSGAEMYHYGIVGTDGVTPTSGGKQYQQAAQEIALLRTLRKPDAVRVEYARGRRRFFYATSIIGGILTITQADWCCGILMHHASKQFGALKRVGCPVDVITEDKDFLLVSAFDCAGGRSWWMRSWCACRSMRREWGAFGVDVPDGAEGRRALTAGRAVGDADFGS